MVKSIAPNTDPPNENMQQMMARHAEEKALLERKQRLEKGEGNAQDLKWQLETKEKEWTAKFKELEKEVAQSRRHTCPPCTSCGE